MSDLRNLFSLIAYDIYPCLYLGHFVHKHVISFDENGSRVVVSHCSANLYHWISYIDWSTLTINQLVPKHSIIENLRILIYSNPLSHSSTTCIVSTELEYFEETSIPWHDFCTAVQSYFRTSLLSFSTNPPLKKRYISTTI